MRSDLNNQIQNLNTDISRRCDDLDRGRREKSDLDERYVHLNAEKRLVEEE